VALYYRYGKAAPGKGDAGHAAVPHRSGMAVKNTYAITAVVRLPPVTLSPAFAAVAGQRQVDRGALMKEPRRR
jgi:hypothetical protein